MINKINFCENELKKIERRTTELIQIKIYFKSLNLFVEILKRNKNPEEEKYIELIYDFLLIAKEKDYNLSLREDNTLYDFVIHPIGVYLTKNKHIKPRRKCFNIFISLIDFLFYYFSISKLFFYLPILSILYFLINYIYNVYNDEKLWEKRKSDRYYRLKNFDRFKT